MRGLRGNQFEDPAPLCGVGYLMDFEVDLPLNDVMRLR